MWSRLLPQVAAVHGSVLRLRPLAGAVRASRFASRLPAVKMALGTWVERTGRAARQLPRGLVIWKGPPRSRATHDF